MSTKKKRSKAKKAPKRKAAARKTRSKKPGAKHILNCKGSCRLRTNGLGAGEVRLRRHGKKLFELARVE